MLNGREAEREQYDDELVEEIFGFHTPSPDDVVLAARSQATGRSAAASDEPPSATCPAEVSHSMPAGDTAAAAATRPQPSAAPQIAKPAATSAKAASSRPYAPRRPEAAAEAPMAAAAEGTGTYCIALFCILHCRADLPIEGCSAALQLNTALKLHRPDLGRRGVRPAIRG